MRQGRYGSVYSSIFFEVVLWFEIEHRTVLQLMTCSGGAQDFFLLFCVTLFTGQIARDARGRMHD
jgi:hypothetical protein